MVSFSILLQWFYTCRIKFCMLVIHFMLVASGYKSICCIHKRTFTNQWCTVHRHCCITIRTYLKHTPFQRCVVTYFTEITKQPWSLDGLRRYEPSGALSISMHSAACLLRFGWYQLVIVVMVCTCVCVCACRRNVGYESG